MTAIHSGMRNHPAPGSRVLVKKLDWAKERAKEAKEALRSLSTVVVDPEASISIVKGSEADNRILECAVEARADFLITGDKRHLLPLETFRGVKVVSPADFLELCDGLRMI